MHATGRPVGSQLEQALRYAARGYPVFPVHAARDGRCACRKGPACNSPAKHPAHTRRGFHEATTDSATIIGWFERSPACNIGLATGAVSGTVVLDEDPRHGGDQGLAKLEAELGKLPETVAAKTGGGGRHLVLMHPPGQWISSRVGVGQGVDVKADGGYIIVDPSVHVSGKQYAWLPGLDPFTMTPAVLPTAWLEFLFEPPEAPRARKADSADEGQLSTGTLPDATDAFTRLPALESLEGSVKQAMQQTLPARAGTRNDCLFDLARTLKGLPGLADAQPADLADLIREWHRLALPNIRTRAVEESIADFASAWRRVKAPRGQGAFTAIAARALSSDPPGVAFLYDRPGQRALVALCCELQRSAGDAPFYLACRTAGRLLGVNFVTASRWLKRLVDDGILETAVPANKLQRQATRFRYRSGS